MEEPKYIEMQASCVVSVAEILGRVLREAELKEEKED